MRVDHPATWRISLDGAERMVGGDALLEIDVAKHHPLARLGSPHPVLPALRSRHDTPC